MAKYVRRYQRRSSKSIRRSKQIPIILGFCALVLVLVGIVVLAATLVGLKLKDEAAKHEDTTEIQYIEPEVDIKAPNGEVRDVNAQIFRFDYSLGEFLGREITHLSIMLRDTEGTLYYNSEVAQAVSWDSVYKSVDLSEKVENIHKRGGYICSYMYLNSFSDDSNIAEMKQAYEKQLMLEAAACGVDEILILGIDLTEENLFRIISFLSEIKAGAENCKIGIELDYDEIVSSDPDSYSAQMILQVCDFITLDASSVPCAENAEELGLQGDAANKEFSVAIEEIYYYMSGMKVRVTFNNNENSMYKSISDCSYVNRQMHE